MTMDDRSREAFRKSFGDNLRAVRKARGVSRKELGYRIGAKRLDYIGDWEAGKSLPRVETLAKLCLALNASADTILFGRGLR